MIPAMKQCSVTEKNKKRTYERKYCRAYECRAMLAPQSRTLKADWSALAAAGHRSQTATGLIVALAASAGDAISGGADAKNLPTTTDTQFLKYRKLRQTCCDHCGKLCVGSATGASGIE